MKLPILAIVFQRERQSVGDFYVKTKFNKCRKEISCGGGGKLIGLFGYEVYKPHRIAFYFGLFGGGNLKSAGSGASQKNKNPQAGFGRYHLI